MLWENEIRNLLDMEGIKNISIDDSLQEAGMDSIMFINFIIKIEELCQTDFPADKLSFEEAGTIRKICPILKEMENQ